MEKEYSATEKQQALEALEKKQNRLYIQGKIIVFVIAILNIVSAAASVCIDLNLITLIVQIALSIALLCGVSWVRYFFAIGAGLSAFLSLYLLCVYMDFSVHLGIAIYLMITMIYSIVSCVVLFVSKSVSEFLYAQKIG